MLHPLTAPGTYSIVAVDREQGDVGCAVQSRAFPVGAIVPWVRAGVGAIATQSYANLSYGPRGLYLLAEGLSPEETLQELVREDDLRERRQVAAVRMDGVSARWTGSEVNPWHGSAHGPDYSCQGNLLSGPEVIAAMARAFEESAGEELAERLMRTLEAAEAAGGDLRGSQSAALVVARWDGRGDPPVGHQYDLRVDEHRQPVPELRRIFDIKRAYAHAQRARALATDGSPDARGEVEAALSLAPEDDYLHALAGEVYYRLEDPDQAAHHLGRAIDLNPKARCYLTLFGADALYPADFVRKFGERGDPE